MSTLHIAKDGFAFLMIGLLTLFATEETKTIDTREVIQKSSVITNPKTKKAKKIVFDKHTADKCFDLNYPIQILNPNGSQVTVNSDKALDKYVVSWFNKHPNSNTEPTFSYPFEITLHNGHTKWMKNEKQFLNHATACDNQILNENHTVVNTFCFDFIYPIQLNIPNGKTQKAYNAEQVDKAIQQWNSNNPDSSEELVIEFPVKIKFDDGQIISLEEIEALTAAIQYCEDDSLEYEEEVETTTPTIGA